MIRGFKSPKRSEKVANKKGAVDIGRDLTSITTPNKQTKKNCVCNLVKKWQFTRAVFHGKDIAKTKRIVYLVGEAAS